MPDYKDFDKALSSRPWWPYVRYGSLVLLGLLTAVVVVLALTHSP